MTAQTSDGSIKTYSYAALFFSEPDYDGYIKQLPNSYMNHAADAEPGIIAGEPAGSPTTHDKGFLSFHTGDLGASAIILGAKLRLRQASDGSHFDPNSRCMVDIKNGYFGTSAGLDRAADFNDNTQTSTNVFAIFQPDASQNNWFEAVLTGAMAARNINLTADGRTQFRIYFPPGGGTPGRNEEWNSGNSTDYPPQLLIRYQ